jgi:hypothetical protein
METKVGQRKWDGRYKKSWMGEGNKSQTDKVGRESGMVGK